MERNIPSNVFANVSELSTGGNQWILAPCKITQTGHVGSKSVSAFESEAEAFAPGTLRPGGHIGVRTRFSLSPNCIGLTG